MNVNLVVSSSAGNTWLDLYEEQPIKLTFNIEDILEATPKSEFSRQFRVPATDTNYEFFKTAFEVIGVDFNPGVKVSARILLDGDEFKQGELRLQNVYRNDVTGKIDYECVFLGRTKSFASVIGKKHIGELDWSDYNFLFDVTNITASWQAYPEGNDADALNDGDVIFPLVDFGNTYNGTTTEQTRIALDHPSADGGSIEKSNHPLSFNRFKPMVRIREIVKRIFEQSGFTVSGQFFESNNDVRKMYLSAWGDDDSITTPVANSNLAKFFAANPTSLITDQLSNYNVNYPNFEFDYGNNLFQTQDILGTPPGQFFSGYTIPLNGVYEYDNVATFKFVHPENTSDLITVTHTAPSGDITSYRFSFGPGTGGCAGVGSQMDVFKEVNGGGYGFVASICGSEVFSNPNPGGLEIFFYEFTVADTFSLPAATAGQTIIPWRMSNSPGDFSLTATLDGESYLEVTQAVGELNIASMFNTKHKCIDFLKDVFKMFRLVLIPNPDNPTDFEIIPWQQYIGSGEVKDWTNKVDNGKDLVIRPLILDQTDELILTMAEDEDVYNNNNQTVFDESFGTRRLDSVYDILEGETTIETKVAPTPASQIEGYESDSNWEDFTIPQIHALDSDGAETKHEPIKPKPRILYYTGLRNIGTSRWYLQDSNLNPPEAKSNVPVVSFSNQMPQGGPNNRNLLFERETTWVGAPSPYHPITGQDLYGLYWSNYVGLIYNKDARRVTTYVVLDEVDIVNFRYNDVIYVAGVYYYVEKIYDAPLGQNSNVKVDLITLKNYRPTVTPVLPPSMTLWEDISDQWQTITTNWENV